MSAGISFWKRFGNAFRANGGRRNNGGGAALVIEPTDPLSAQRDKAPGRGPSVSSLLPWVRRGQSLKQLNERYQRVVELMDALRDHFERQDHRAEQLTAGLDRVGGTLEQLTETQRTQSKCVASIAARVEEATKHSAGLSTVLLQLPGSLQAQAEAVRSISREMEATRAADEHLMSSLRRFSQAADSLCQAGTAQVETMQRLRDTGENQRESLETFVRGQTRLLLTLTVIVATLGLGAVAALGWVARTLFS